VDPHPTRQTYGSTMTFSLRKCANSVDPRDWHYLREWQRWGEFMPPWKYTFRAPYLGTPSNIPFYGAAVSFEPDPASVVEVNQSWDVTINTFSPEFPFTEEVFHFFCSITVFDPASGNVDPLGNPATVVMYGEFETIGLSAGYFMGSWWLPPYDQPLDTVVRETPSWTGPLHPFYPSGIFIRPTRFDFPDLL